MSFPILPEKQTNLLLEEKVKFTATGPVFEFGPGWGTITKDWLKKYYLKIVFPLIALALIVTTAVINSKDIKDESLEVSLPEKIQLLVIRGDSYALLARKAIAEYIKQNPTESLSLGQKLFIEEKLRRSIQTQQLLAGLVIEFDLANIKSVLAESKQLSSFQLQKWQELAEKARLK